MTHNEHGIPRAIALASFNDMVGLLICWGLNLCTCRAPDFLLLVVVWMGGANSRVVFVIFLEPWYSVTPEMIKRGVDTFSRMASGSQQIIQSCRITCLIKSQYLKLQKKIKHFTHTCTHNQVFWTLDKLEFPLPLMSQVHWDA